MARKARPKTPHKQPTNWNTRSQQVKASRMDMMGMSMMTSGMRRSMTKKIRLNYPTHKPKRRPTR